MSSSRPDLRSLKRRLAGLRDHLAADLAVRQGKLSREALERGLEAAEDEGRPLGSVLEEAGAIPAGLLESCAAEVRIEDLRRLVAPGPLPDEVRGAAADPSRRLGRYLLGREIGRGGMGVVYRAWQEDLGRWVALKMLRPEAVGLAVARFVQEARLAAQVAHPNLVSIYEVGQERGLPYLAMALLDGGSLDGARLPFRQAAEAVRTAADAAAEIHRHGIVHRDIKPGNLLRDSRGRLYLGDFGLARGEAGAKLSASGTMVGTVGFAAPEQIRGRHAEIGPRSDVYALGATLFALVSGRPPFEGPDFVTVAQRAATEEPPHLPGVPRDLNTICRRAMAKRPEDRYASAAEFAEDLKRFLDGEPIRARPEGTLRRVARVATRRPAWIIAAGLALLTTVVILSPRRTRPEAVDTEALKQADRSRRSLARARELLAGGRPRVAEAHEALREAMLGGGIAAAEAWFLLGDLDRAESALRSLPPDADMRRLLGIVLLERAVWDLGSGRRPSASSVEEAVSLLGPGDRVPPVFRALAELQPAEAERLATAEIDSGASDVTYEILRGMARLYLGNPQGAEGDFAQALRHAPGRALAWYGRATARERLHRLEEAAEDFERTFELRPSYVMALRNRADVQRRLGRLGGALETLDRARKAAPGDPGVLTDRINLLTLTGRTADALAEADALVSAHPDEPTSRVARAKARQSAGNVDGALEEYAAALKLDPGYAPALAGRGELRVKQGAFVGADEDLTRAIEGTPNPRDLGVWLSWRAKARAGRRDWEGAYRDYDEVVKRMPDDPGMLFNRGVAAFNTGRKEEAKRDLEEAIRRRPELEAAGRPILEAIGK